MSGLRDTVRRHTRLSDELAQTPDTIRQIESDLLDQGIKLYPSTTTGERARSLWLQIKPDLLRGRALELTASTTRLSMHRQELKRARDVLVEMGLIKLRLDGRYALGKYHRVDDLIRDQFLDLKLLEEVAVALSQLMPKSKTRKKRRRS